MLPKYGTFYKKDSYIYKNIRTSEKEFLSSMMDEFINMIMESENISSIPEINSKVIL